MADDFLKMQIGLDGAQFCDLLEETIKKLVAVIEKPAEHDSVRVDMARGALRILLKGPHFIPRGKKMGYVDDLVHLLVAREALFPGDVQRKKFDSIIVGVPEPPRKQLMELASKISEGSPDCPDADLVRGAQDELEAIGWRHPGRLALYQRIGGLVATAVVLFVAYQIDQWLVGRGTIPSGQVKILMGLQLFFILATNLSLSIVLLRQKSTDEWGPALVDMSEENRSQISFIVNGVLQHAVDIWVKQPMLACAGGLFGFGFGVFVILRGQETAQWVVNTISHWLWAFWVYIH